MKLAERRRFLTVARYEDELRATLHNGLGAVERGYVFVLEDVWSGADWALDALAALAAEHGAQVVLLDGWFPAGSDRCGTCGERLFRIAEGGRHRLLEAEPNPFPVVVRSQAVEEAGLLRLYAQEPDEGCLECGARRRRLRLLHCDQVARNGRYFLALACDRCLRSAFGGACPFCRRPFDGGGDHGVEPYVPGALEALRRAFLAAAEGEPIAAD